VLQLGFLKMLKGTKLRAESETFKAVFADFAPYEVYRTETMPYSDFIRLKKIEGIIERFYNTGGFTSSIGYAIKSAGSPYKFFEEFSDYLANPSEIKISLKNAYTALYNFLSRSGNEAQAACHIKTDCLSFDAGASLPDAVPSNRDRQAEEQFRIRNSEFGINGRFRIEIFADNTRKLFDLEKKNPVTSRYGVKDI